MQVRTSAGEGLPNVNYGLLDCLVILASTERRPHPPDDTLDIAVSHSRCGASACQNVHLQSMQHRCRMELDDIHIHYLM